MRRHIGEMEYARIVIKNDNLDYQLNPYICRVIKNARVPLLSPQPYRNIATTDNYNCITTSTATVHIKSDEEMDVVELQKQLYGDHVKSTSYLQNRCMTCGRVPVGKNFELLHDAYAEIVIKMCRHCYIRFYYAHENSSSDRWTVIT